MPRQVRIEYAGAVYHVMARGDRREPVFVCDWDRDAFLKALGAACGRTGWRVHAYALMGNHYHAVIETPRANLVAGMTWLQNAFTRRYNVKHDLWGHLFGGRYRAVLVDDERGDYFRRVVDYVHLNPVRAGLVQPGDGLETYRWTSLVHYASPPRRRPEWLFAERGLAAHDLSDTARGRRRYLEELGARAESEREEAGEALPAGQSLNSTLKRGWAFGGEAFRERMLALADEALGNAGRSPNYGDAPELKDHAERRADQIVRRGLRELGLAAGDLPRLRKSDPRKALVAHAVRSSTTVPLAWIAERLAMGTPSTVSRCAGDAAAAVAESRKLRGQFARILARKNA